MIRDHPRLCGEKVKFLNCHTILKRITPAYAGKSKSSAATANKQWDHPRLCGEKKKRRSLRMGFTGSPPPMRGKGDSTARAATRARITPAYAGKRCERSKHTRRKGDHPRLCGEKHPHRSTFHSVQGSPPPMRGKVDH